MKKFIKLLPYLLFLFLLLLPAKSTWASDDATIIGPEDNETDTDAGDDELDEPTEPAPEDMHTTYTLSATADYKEIQRALNKAKKLKEGQSITVVVPAGTHIISRKLRIYSHTTLRLEDGAVMEAHFTPESNPGNGEKGSMIYASHLDQNGDICVISKCPHRDYDRTSDIVIEGGAWNRRSDQDSDHVTGIISIRFATNVTIRNTILYNATEHFMNVSATKNTRIENVTFRDQVIYTDKTNYEFWTNYSVTDRYAFCEALHVDYLPKHDETGKPTTEHLGCENVTVQNCTFENVGSGIGTHHPQSVTSQNISIIGNTFTNVSGRCIDAYGYENLVVSNNIYTLANYNKTSYFIYAYKGSGTISNNIVSGSRCFLRASYGANYNVQANTITNCGWHAIYLYNSKQMLIQNNTITGTGNAFVHLTNYSSATVQSNVGTNIGSHFIYTYIGSSVTATQNRCQNAGNTFLTVNKYCSATATNNTATNLGTHGFKIAETSTGKLAYNKITNTTLSSVIISTTYSGSYIQNNVFDNAGTYGVEIIKVGSNCQITGNTFNNPVKCDFYIEHAPKLVNKNNSYFFTKGILKYQVISPKKNVIVTGITDKKVKTLSIPATVTSGLYKYNVVQIGEKAFRNCKRLKELTIGKNIRHIKDKAFMGCNKLHKITIKCTKLKTVGFRAFGGAHKKVKVYMKKKKMKKYTPLFNDDAIRKSKRILEL